MSSKEGASPIRRPGDSAQHKGPDGLSRNVEGRRHLIPAKSADVDGYRQRFRGIVKDIQDGLLDDEDPEPLITESGRGRSCSWASLSR